MFIDSVYQRRANLCRMIAEGKVDTDVIAELIIDGIAIKEEAVLWDFKLELPNSAKNSAEKKLVDAKFCEIMKDCVSFYNSHGGYLVIGIEDKSGNVTGFNSDFDAPDLNKRLHAATGRNIETIFRTIKFEDKELGLLFIPKRKTGTNPAQFTKSAVENPFGKKAYNAGDFYFRLRDTCIPASTPEDYEFLYGARDALGVPQFTRSIENNLPVRDPDLGELRGREHELACLWSWLADQFNPVHILSGLGGLGKTSVAYTFSERVAFNTTPALDRIIWLGAKKETFSGSKGIYTALTRVDFDNIDNLLLEVISEAGCPPEQLPEEPSRDQLLSLAVEHLSAFRYLLIVDNVDTLPDEDQHLIFNLLTQICSLSHSKAIITARRNLGASRAFYTEMSGLSGVAFEEMVKDKCQLLRIKQPSHEELQQLREASGGSPLFALSFLRLVSLGDSYREAIKNWQGSDGEAVRAAAFQAEVARLTPHEGRVLLVLGYLKTASIAEISSVLGLNRFDIQKALEGLQNFSMTTIDTSLPGGSAFTLPASLYLVTDLLEKRVADWTKIKAQCDRLNSLRENKTPFVGQAITRCISYLRNGDFTEAIDVAKNATGALPDNEDLHCLLGRCYLEADALPKAEEQFIRAFDLGCTKRDLFEGWLTVCERTKDWRGVVDVSIKAEKAQRSARYAIARNNARIQIGDEFARSGGFAEADASYISAMDDMRNWVHNYSGQGDRASLWRLYEAAVFRWIGSIQAQSDGRPDSNRRMFGAVFKAATVYHFWNERLLKLGNLALRNWLDDLERRKTISDYAREKIAITYRYAEKLCSTFEQKSSLLEGGREEIIRSLQDLITRLERFEPKIG